ncbi:MAG TPA: alpha/beta fold hydrolase [Methylomirabilota bacterium]|nr:alpha/beta fold hydrolase [Methylomirabilota bacterium]
MRATAATSAPAPSPAATRDGFRPAWWCRNRHLQTLWGPLFRRASLPLRRERIATADGDFLDLDWLDGPAGAPLLVVLHGLEGSARSHYVIGLLGEGRARGWRGVALNFRGCSGEANRLPRFYHSGDTADVDHVLGQLVTRDGDARIGAVGVSLGGNVLLKWLGEQGEAAPRQVVAAVAISVPFDLASCAAVLDRGVPRLLYTANFLRTMRRKVREKAALFPGFVDLAAVGRSRTFAAYDRVVTAPLHGFRDERDYWVRAASGPYLARVRRPTLLIGALDDPFVPPATLPDPAALPAGVCAEFPTRGGHAGFLEGPWPGRVRSWAERRAVAFLAPHLETRSSRRA